MDVGREGHDMGLVHETCTSRNLSLTMGRERSLNGPSTLAATPAPATSFPRCGNRVNTTDGSLRSVNGGTAPANVLTGSKMRFNSVHSATALGPPKRSKMGSKFPAPMVNLKDPSGTCMTQPSYCLYSTVSPSPTKLRICLNGLYGRVFMPFHSDGPASKQKPSRTNECAHPPGR